jgi:hypothetical protein
MCAPRMHEAIVIEWIGELMAQGFGPDDPLFPATKIAQGANRHFAAVGLARKHWRDAGAIRRIFKQAFERAGLPNYNPHSFRHTLAVMGEKICRTPEEWKAYSQNFGHSSAMTTFNSYGPVAPHRQAEILNALVDIKPVDANGPTQIVKLADDQVRLILNQLARHELGIKSPRFVPGGRNATDTRRPAMVDDLNLLWGKVCRASRLIT